MRDKFVAGLVAAVAIAPICALCILGPAAAISVVAGAAGWLGGAGPVLTIGVMLAAGALVWRTLRRREFRRELQSRGGAEPSSQPATPFFTRQQDHGS